MLLQKRQRRRRVHNSKFRPRKSRVPTLTEKKRKGPQFLIQFTDYHFLFKKYSQDEIFEIVHQEINNIIRKIYPYVPIEICDLIVSFTHKKVDLYKNYETLCWSKILINNKNHIINSKNCRILKMCHILSNMSFISVFSLTFTMILSFFVMNCNI